MIYDSLYTCPKCKALVTEFNYEFTQTRYGTTYLLENGEIEFNDETQDYTDQADITIRCPECEKQLAINQTPETIEKLLKQYAQEAYP